MKEDKEDKNQKNPIGRVQEREITEEMKEAYLDYAMSVIVSRALPDVRDGLKPVHRRILYAMHTLSLSHNSKFKKSAAVVGEVISKYHPHGDIAIYDSMVRMAQDFSLRYPLVDGQGNFGSIDGDAAAAYRYTEARLTAQAEEMLSDIEKNVVDFQDNYDGTKKEPKVLPSKIPQMLLNGIVGIAVGMATNIPPHNLRELADGIISFIDNPNITNEDLSEIIKGPDFPTGGIIYNKKEIASAYASGKGPIVTRGKAEISEAKNGKFRIIISEIPFQVNKSSLIEKIAQLAQDKKVEGIRDIRDESDKEGMRIVIELKGGAYPQKILNKLYKYTDLQKTFHLNMLALVDGIQPQVLSLRSSIEYFVSHRKEIVRRRTEFDLAKAEERAHILEGLKKALDHIDLIIKTIRSSETKEEAYARLKKKFGFSDTQTSAILEMKLQQLAGLERQKVEDELKEKKCIIKDLTFILKNPKKILQIIKDELLAMKNKYGDERRTRVVSGGVSEFKEEDLVPSEEVVVILTHDGYIKRIKPENYKSQKRGGKGVIGTGTKEEDVVEQFLACDTHDNALFFTTKGKVYQTRAFDIPETPRASKGKAIVNFLDIEQSEKVTAIVSCGKSEKSQGYFVMATKNGIIKKVEAKNFLDIRKSGIIAIGLKGGDALRWVKQSDGSSDIMIITKKGQAIRFSEKSVRSMGRSASGVSALKLKGGDEAVGMEVVLSKLDKKLETKLLVVTENGFGKRTEIGQYKVQGRGGSGIKTASITEKTGTVAAAKVISQKDEDLIAISQKGQAIRVPISGISVLGRATQGVRIMKLDKGDKVASITTV